MARLDYVESEDKLFSRKEIAILKTTLEAFQRCIEEISVIREHLGLDTLDIPSREDFIKRIKRNMRDG